ncbi:hypothetical protein BDV95DRAFT_199728 [Massariosphaeria phaeospora]|uniref:Peptidase A1 domain-containing protein n=1 Tax=Massariosphaeria phaeospora TaxID=100035 RepID=A0A7C8MGY2_9PLEO|nr:hypothetical protein BDV95DRAFT_199728 [Massariosphaeria phaeospora]
MVLHQINVYILYFVGFLVLLGNTAPVFEDSGPLVFDLIRIRGANDSYGKRDDTPVVLEQLLQQLGRFGIKIILKGRSYILHLDSGTPSTWIAQEDFQCYDKSKHPQSQDYCKLGPGLAPSLSEGGFQALGYFKESYGDGEHATGQWIRETAEIGGLRVNDVLIALIDELFWEGDGLTVGLFGMSWYPGISSVWQVLCSSWGLPVQFTLAINRGYEGNNGGSIAIGGILDGEPVTPDSWETVPLSGQKGWFIEGFELQTIKIDKSTLVDSGKCGVRYSAQPLRLR